MHVTLHMPVEMVNTKKRSIIIRRGWVAKAAVQSALTFEFLGELHMLGFEGSLGGL